MKVVLLAGGLGTRLSEETVVKPKPMIEIGGRPILWHIMKIYSNYGFNEFVICLGYKGYMIKEYFSNYFLHMSDVSFDIEKNVMEIHHKYVEPWKVTLVDTGQETMTGGRLKRIREYINGSAFLMTYGDGVADIDIKALVEFHNECGRLVSVTAVQPPGRFGSLRIDDNSQISCFREKPIGDGSWINGGFFVLEPQVFDYIEGDATIWERGPLEKLAECGQLAAFKHFGFWRPMDTLRDKVLLEELWNAGRAPWKMWI